jgi:hypothetical protein
MAKRIRMDLIEDSLITLHFAAPTTPEEAEALNALKLASGKIYGKTVQRSKILAQWYKAYRFMVETGKNELEDISA